MGETAPRQVKTYVRQYAAEQGIAEEKKRMEENDVRKILDEKLGVRNSSAHPSGITIHPTKVINFIEDLVDNVVVKYVV